MMSPSQRQHQRQRPGQKRLSLLGLRTLLSLAAATLLATAVLSPLASAQSPSKVLHDAVSKPAISKSFSVQHSLIPNSALVANWGKLPASTVWSPKTAIVLNAYDLSFPSMGGAAPRASLASRVWDAKVDVTHAPAQAAGGLTVMKPADSMYAVRIVGDDVTNPEAMVRLYPACWVSSSDSIRLHIDESGALFAFDWVPGPLHKFNRVPGSPVCSESDKVIVDMHTEAQVAAPKLLPRPLKPVPASAKLATPRPRLKTGYKPPAKPTGNAASGAETEPAVKPEPEVDPLVREMDDEPELGDVDVEDKPEDRRSFLSKYWMYIVPVILLVIMGGPAEEPKKSGAGTGGARGAAASAKR